MTTLGIIQIIYLALNILGTVGCFITLFADFSFEFILIFFDFIKKRLGTVVTLIICSLIILIFIPTITMVSVFLTFLLIFGYYAD